MKYRLGNGVSDILHGVKADIPAKFKEVSRKSELIQYCGVYLKDKVEIEMIENKLYFSRFKGNLHIEIYPVGKDEFARRYFDQLKPYHILINELGQPVFFGYSKKGV